MRVAFIVAASATLAACQQHVESPSAVVHDTVTVEVPVACPSPSQYAEIAGTRPKPLAGQPMPESWYERQAKTTGQLGLYEAPGGWADRAMATLKRCSSPP